MNSWLNQTSILEFTSVPGLSFQADSAQSELADRRAITNSAEVPSPFAAGVVVHGRRTGFSEH